MKNAIRFTFSAALIVTFFINALPCGPSYITPVFEYKHAPENPYANFAAGKIGILKPSQRRIVLVAAYRYLNGGGFSEPEQKALVEVWNGEFNNKPYEDEDISGTVRKWVEQRKSVAGKEEKLPEIYVERENEGFEFFPNCTKNAFETATQTLSDRAASHGSEDRFVKDWLKAQDKVFENCSSGKSKPDGVDESMPEWLRKDRAYQLAAAEFYSLDYLSAKRRFEEIARDSASPWQETAEYLVGRTLIRQASLSKDKSRTGLIYTEAEQIFSQVASRGGKFSESADKLLGLIKYRMRPQERIHELAQAINSQGGPNFRQNLVDYNWLMDKFEKESLEAEEKRQEAAKKTADGNPEPEPTLPPDLPATQEPEPGEDEIKITVYSEDYAQSWSFIVKADAPDSAVLVKAEEVVGRPLTDKMKEQVRFARKTAYRGRFDGNNGAEYQGGYYGPESLRLSILPEYLRQDDLTNWLFAFQAQNAEAYEYSLAEWRRTKADIWLLTAISKAETKSTDLDVLLDAAEKVDRSAVAYPTVAFHHARLQIELGKVTEAKKMLDDLLNSTVEMPISSRNKFLALRAGLAGGLDDYLKFAQLKPFAFDWDGTGGTIDDFIALRKSWYSPESYPNQSREEYDKEVDESFVKEKLWENRSMFDYKTISSINQYFPVTVLTAAGRSPALPEYLRERFGIAVWSRAVLLNDFVLARNITPDVVRYHPELKDAIDKVNAAKTPVAKQRAALFATLKNPILSPFVEDGLGKADNTFDGFDANDWWCAPYEPEEGETSSDFAPPQKPPFLSAAQIASAATERRKLLAIGDAPKYMGEKVLEWARLAPLDPRVPESLFIAWQANGWTKYGCGSNEELKAELGALLKKKYADSEWTAKLIEEEKDQ